VAFSLAGYFLFSTKRKYARRSAAEPSGSANKHARASDAKHSASAITNARLAKADPAASETNPARISARITPLLGDNQSKRASRRDFRDIPY
jgi:hypothetical protein